MSGPSRRPNRDIDWNGVRARLDQLGNQMEESFRLSPERTRQILDERARAIRQAPPEIDDAAARIEVLTISLVNERYAIETRYVREVGPLVDVTPVPGTPEFVRGVGNLRGEITAIIELGRFFGIGTQSRTDLSRLVVLGAERVEFGIVADDVREVISLPIETLSALDMATTRVDRTYLRGVTTDALIVLDGAALLNDHRLMIDHDRGSLAVAPNGRLQ